MTARDPIRCPSCGMPALRALPCRVCALFDRRAVA